MVISAMGGSAVGHDEFQRVERLFQAAADRAAPERAAFLERECRGDADLRARVERLLDRLDETLDAPEAARPLAAAAITEGPGTIIGRYKLLQNIGEGGFGIVYMAEQQEPVVRKVALKIIKLGMDTREVVARFEAERQALAMMDHPHIARVLDGGSTASGRPYFVMELVRGVSITEFCDADDLTTDERLRLFLQVCHAVQHAHQKGVIHRDLKPSNVLVTLHDGAPMPKIIDFGVAKAMHTRLTEKTLFTRYEQFIGTPAYMSPEQAELSALDVDTRTDIYSLGVLLYELLTGTTPFDTATLHEAGLLEMQRVIREQEPPRPSVRVSTTGDAAVARRRGLDVPALGRLLRGDLDWIVMKALEKDRSRRYDSAGELAEDIRRHLADEPVAAGPPRASYRLRKFLTRNRAAVGVAALVAVVLLAGAIGTTLAMFRANDNAELASDQARRALEAVDFLLATLSLTNPEVALDPGVSVLTLLDHTSKALDAAFTDDPGVEVRVRATVGRAYFRLGQQELAEPHLRRVVEIVEAHTAPDGSVDAAVSSAGFDELERYLTLWVLTNVCFNLERPDAYAMSNRARDVGLAHLGASHSDAASLLLRFAKAVEANAWSLDPDAMAGVPEIFEEARISCETALPAGDPRWPIVLDRYLAAGYTIWYTPHEPLAEQFWSEALRIQRRELPADHPDLAVTVNLLVGLYNKQGRQSESERLLVDSLASLRRVHQEGSFSIAATESLLGQTLAEQRRFQEAEPLLMKSHERLLAAVGENNWLVLESCARIIAMYDAWDRPELALDYRESMASAGAASRYPMQWVHLSRAFGPADRELHDAAAHVDELCGGLSYMATPGTRTAENLLPAVAAVTRLHAELDDPTRTLALARLFLGWANALDPQAHREVRCLLAAAARGPLAAAAERLPLDSAEAAVLLADCARDNGDRETAKQRAREAWRDLAAGVPPGDWFTASRQVRIARGLIAEGMFEQAERLLVSAHEQLSVQLGAGHTDTREARAQLRRLYTAWGRPDEAARHAEAPAEAPGRG